MFSIIITSFNRLDLLKRSLHSALQQTYNEPYEIIIVDDASNEAYEDYI